MCDQVNTMHNQRINLVEKWYTEILENPFDFKVKETLEFDENSPKYLNNEIELKEFWRKSLKQQVLERLARKIETQEKAILRKDTVFKKLSYDTLESQSRKEVLKLQEDWFKRLKKFNKTERLSIYFNCLTECLTPIPTIFHQKTKKILTLE